MNSVRLFFDSIAEGKNLKTSFRKSGVSKRVKRKLDALFRVEKKKTRQGRILVEEADICW